MPIELYRANYTSPKRAKARGKAALGTALGSVTQSLVDSYKASRAREGHIDRLLAEIEYNLLGEVSAPQDMTATSAAGTPLAADKEQP